MGEPINLSEGKKFKIKETILEVYPASFEELAEFAPFEEKLQKAQKFTEQLDTMTDAVFCLIKQYNTGLTKAKLKKILTLKAANAIIKAAAGVDTPDDLV